MPLTLEQQNAYRDRYATLRPGWQPATIQYEAIIRNRLHPDMNVLDAGCGRGGVLEQLGDAVTCPLGIDPDHTSLREHRMLSLPRAAASAGAIPLATESLDLVLSSWVLEHLAEPARFLEEAARVLRPGGALVFMTPNAFSPVAVLNRGLQPLRDWLVPLLYRRESEDVFPAAYHANTRPGLMRLAAGAGLSVLEIHLIKDPTYTAFHPAIFWMSVLLSRLTPVALAEHIVGVCIKSADVPELRSDFPGDPNVQI